MQPDRSTLQRYTRAALAALWIFPLLLPVTVYGSDSSDEISKEQAVVWHSYDEAQAKAAEENKPLFIFVEAEWCLPCKQMKSEVFPKREISRLLNENYYAVSIDVDSRDKLNYMGETFSERKFAREMQVSTTPTMLFMETDGNELGRQPGAIDSDELMILLRFVDSEYFGKLTLEEFQNLDPEER